ncbi:cobalamin-dependent protein [Sulfitobacter sp. JB4-11]|uniref:cobalamin-dependent protein n=1 Tax=Sulfitobacter rhodophyticola TaxID=3238304 RepID=UPI0035141456
MTKPTDPTQSLTGSEVSRIALQAINLLAPDLQDAFARRKHLDVYVNQLLAAALSTNQQGMRDVLRDMRKARISNAQIAENYIPTVARALGVEWCEDRLDFGAVTIGCARLQGLLRRMEADWEELHAAHLYHRPGYLVGVPAGVQHSLGASVLAGQLRERGMPVLVEYDLTPARITEYLGQTAFAGVMLSGSGRKCLESLRDLVDSVKTISDSTPVIIGGSILEHVKDIQSFTGADMVTSGLGGAMAFCEQSLSDRALAGDINVPERSL